MFDQGVPVPLRRLLVGHVVETAYERGWSSVQNGELLSAAEAAGFQLLVTTDRNLRYQQNLKLRAISVVVLLTTSWPRIQGAVDAARAAVDAALPGSYAEVSIP